MWPQLPRYRIVEDTLGSVRAEFLVIVSLGTSGINSSHRKVSSIYLHFKTLRSYHTIVAAAQGVQSHLEFGVAIRPSRDLPIEYVEANNNCLWVIIFICFCLFVVVGGVIFRLLRRMKNNAAPPSVVAPRLAYRPQFRMPQEDPLKIPSCHGNVSFIARDGFDASTKLVVFHLFVLACSIW